MLEELRSKPRVAAPIFFLPDVLFHWGSEERFSLRHDVLGCFGERVERHASRAQEFQLARSKAKLLSAEISIHVWGNGSRWSVPLIHAASLSRE